MNEHSSLQVQNSREYGPTSVFGRLREEIDHLIDDFSLVRPARAAMAMPGEMIFSPAMELRDRKGRYELAVELPGMDEKDIDVEFSGGVLSISGEKHAESEQKSDGYLLAERSYGAFRRSLTLPYDVDPDGIEAKFRNGVLRIRARKDKHAAIPGRKIAVS